MKRTKTDEETLASLNKELRDAEAKVNGMCSEVDRLNKKIDEELARVRSIKGKIYDIQGYV